MKIISSILLILNLGGAARAFDLQTLKAADVAGYPAGTPAATESSGQTTPEAISAAYATLKDYFAGGYAPVESDLLGDWEGRGILKGETGAWTVWSPTISFIRKTYPSALGPLFQEDSHELYARMPYYGDTLERRVSLGAREASFQFQSYGARTMTFRRFDRGNEVMLVMKTDAYGGTSYTYFFRKKADKQAYTGALPTGDLFGPLPPYYQGQLPPLQAGGQAVPGAYEYSNKLIFYADQAEALAAAEKAAAALRAAGLEVLAVRAEAVDGFYRASVGFSGRKAILFTWDDDRPTAEEAAAIVKRKTDRYASEGYTILETSVKQAGGKYYFFITCAKFY